MRKIILFLPFITLFAACVTTTQQEGLDDLKKEVAKLQIKCANLEAKQAEAYSKNEENMVNLEITNASVQELYKKTSKLSQEVKDLETIVKKQKPVAQQDGEVQVPSEMYETAYNDFLLGKYELAIFGFKSFLKQYKTHDLAVQAQYYIAESLYSQDKWSDAYSEYEKVEKNFSDNNEYVSSSRLKRALCLELLGQKQNSLVILQSILQDYPRSPEAFTAKEKIKQYSNDTKAK